jgi:hypothetical protein
VGSAEPVHHRAGLHRSLREASGGRCPICHLAGRRHGYAANVLNGVPRLQDLQHTAKTRTQGD